LKVILFFLLTFSLYATNYPSFSQAELKNIEKQIGLNVKKRIENYTCTIDSYKTLSKEKQLIQVNKYINTLLPKDKSYYVDKKNYWTTPKEFLTSGLVDCEDYAIIKYYTLLKLGFKEENLFLTTSYDTITKQSHMVLSYIQDNNHQPLILDNLSNYVLKLNKRKDIRVNMFINSSGVYKLDPEHELIKVAKGVKQFKELRSRIAKEG